MYSSSLYVKTVFEIVREESFLHAEPVKPPPPLHLRLPAVAELAVYVFREHHAGAVLSLCVPCPFLSQIRYCCLLSDHKEIWQPRRSCTNCTQYIVLVLVLMFVWRISGYDVYHLRGLCCSSVGGCVTEAKSHRCI